MSDIEKIKTIPAGGECNLTEIECYHLPHDCKERIECEYCNGEGMKVCDTCDGERKFEYMVPLAHGEFAWEETDCHVCDGRPVELCDDCDATGSYLKHDYLPPESFKKWCDKRTIK
tara:strand:- start:4003 stop:4350 length:348 start_codon:yes stop_codon:yes gene_type:complete